MFFNLDNPATGGDLARKTVAIDSHLRYKPAVVKGKNQNKIFLLILKKNIDIGAEVVIVTLSQLKPVSPERSDYRGVGGFNCVWAKNEKRGNVMMKQAATVHNLFRGKEETIRQATRHSMPLAIACAGESVRIAALEGGRGLRQRLMSMGLNIGSEIEVIRKGCPGPFLIAIGDTRLAIGAGMAHKIMVFPVERKAE